MTEKITDRIIKNAEGKNIMEFLTKDLSSSDLQSLLMEVYRQRINRISPAQLLRSYEENRFVQPSTSDHARLLEIELQAFSFLPEGFRALDLSPVGPPGNCSVLTTVDQNNVITTIRNSEVVADATNIMTLEASIKRKALLEQDPKSSTPVKLATSHKLIRTQSFENEKFSTHFRIFGLCTAGRDQGSFLFETENLLEHIRIYLDMIHSEQLRDICPDPEVLITDIKGDYTNLIEDKIIAPLQQYYPKLRIRLFPERKSALNYYEFICLSIRVKDKKGNPYDVVDGGFTRWTQILLSNKKERLLTTGIGTELLYRLLEEKEQ